MTTIKDLKELVKDLPDDMPVGGSGHFGEYLDFYKGYVRTVYNNSRPLDIFCISIKDRGEEPP